MHPDYANILDFFRYVKEQKMCTTPYCSTCGATMFRDLCKEIGFDRIKSLLESTSDEDLARCNVDLWYNPLKIMLIDGFRCDDNSAVMTRYRKGYEYLMYGPVRHQLLSIDDICIIGQLGSIFDKKNEDVIGLFANPGLTSLRWEITDFILAKGLSLDQGTLLMCNGKHGNVKAVYYKDTTNAGCRVKEVKCIIWSFLDTVSQHGYHTIAMNGIRTLGYSELDNIRMIKEWLIKNPETSIKQIVLVDKRGGFNTLAQKTV